MEKENLDRRELWVLLGVAFLIRVFFAASVYGFPPDIACFAGWAGQVARMGLARFYEGEMFVDYPPGYIYPLFVVGMVQKLIKLPFDSLFFLPILKMPAVLADLALAFFLYRIGKSKANSDVAVFAFHALLFNPAIILNSALWGQVDSFFMLPLVVGILFLTEGEIVWSSLFFALALLIKPQALIFAPLWLFALVERKSILVTVKSVLLGLGTMILLSLPFASISRLSRIIGIYRGTVASYPYATLNAFNLFALWGGNWVLDRERIWGLPYWQWGYLAIGGILVFSGFLFFTWKGKERFFVTALFLSFSVFLFAHRMHERYLFPALIVALFAYLWLPRRELSFLFTGLSATFFLNTGLILLSAFYGIYQFPRFDWRLRTLAVANCVLWGFMMWFLWRERKSFLLRKREASHAS